MQDAPIKESRFFAVMHWGVLFFFLGIPSWAPGTLEDDSVSNLKRQFIKVYLQAEQGHPEAQYTIGMMFYADKQASQDHALAALWFIKAADQGHTDAQFFLSLMYGLGDGVAQSDQVAAAWCQKAAASGHSEAQYHLAQMYMSGQGVSQNGSLAVVWLTRAAEQGHHQALLMLEEKMSTAAATPLDGDASGKINKEANLLLTSLEEDLLFPEETAEKVETAIETPYNGVNDLESSPAGLAQQRDPKAEDLLSPEINEKDLATIETAKDLPAQAVSPIETMDVFAQYDLALQYHEGKGVTQDPVEAARLFLAAAEQGHPDSQYMLGVAYSFGQGVEQDSTKAAKWFRKAAEQELPSAQYCLGVMYATGQGVSMDSTVAAQWYTRAANQGSVAAQFMLGVIYSKGQGVTRDSATAVQWYTKAAEQDSTPAQYILGVLYEEGKGVVPKDDEKALKWYMRAADGGHPDAQYNLAIKYISGYGVKQKDFVTAYMWCLLAGKNHKDVARHEKWLESKMTSEQLEDARRRAREKLDRAVAE